MDTSYLDRNFEEVKKRIGKAAREAGRDPATITLVPAVKSGETEEVLYLARTYDIRTVGENRVQQLLTRFEAFAAEGIAVNFIGHLQTNKVRQIVGRVDRIDSLDSPHLAAEIEKEAAKRNLVQKVLVEINSGHEEGKDGCLPEEAAAFCHTLSGYPHLAWLGFMTMAPKCEDKSEYIDYFTSVKTLADAIWKREGREGTPVLSMGMSGSFEEAVACGATTVRVGRKLFEK